MASSLLQIRLDDELKSEANALFEALGIDLPTAIRMFLKRFFGFIFIVFATYADDNSTILQLLYPHLELCKCLAYA